VLISSKLELSEVHCFMKVKEEIEEIKEEEAKEK